MGEIFLGKKAASQLQTKGKYAESFKLFLEAFAIAENPEIKKRNEAAINGVNN